MNKSLRAPLRRHVRGLTLVELMVAMTLGMVVTIAAVSMLSLGNTGFGAADSSSQMVDRQRFAVDTVTKVVMQAGYQHLVTATPLTRAGSTAFGADPQPDIYGWNNAAYASLGTSLDIVGTTLIVDGNRNGSCGGVTDTSCRNGSDVLVVRYQGVTGAGGISDNTMINCMGNGEAGVSTPSLDQRAANIFYVARESGSGEPTLYCAYYEHSATPKWVTQPLIEGVEGFQVLYGTDNVTPGVAPGAAGDTVVDRWLRADQLKVAGNLAATYENWRRVRAIRVGMVLRGPRGSAQESMVQTLAPLGSAFANSATDVGSNLEVAADGRLRRVTNFTVHIRNDMTIR